MSTTVTVIMVPVSILIDFKAQNPIPSKKTSVNHSLNLQ